jgi:hypothetical protein
MEYYFLIRVEIMEWTNEIDYSDGLEGIKT